MKIFCIFLLCLIIGTIGLCEPPERSGIAIGYMSTPNSVVFRSSMNENSAMDFWLDIPEFTIGDEGALRLGAGTGYAMFPFKYDNFALMFRPQIAFAYNEYVTKRGSISLGLSATVVAYLDSLGLPNGDVYIGASVGSIMELGEDFTALHMILSRKEPFGIVFGLMKYF